LGLQAENRAFFEPTIFANFLMKKRKKLETPNFGQIDRGAP
jgi:hypothetical protein